MKSVYGPVPSRRLGRSLGVDPIPSKTCNWNCVYCQLGRSTPVVNERADYRPVADLVDEVSEALSTDGRAQVVERYGHRFLSAAGARYAGSR